jgi:intron-binding protein aquarius
LLDEIREDIEDAVSRLKPWVNTDGATEFSGWSRMAVPISSFSVVEVGAPNVGENRPSRVRADVAMELTMNDHIKKEWEGGFSQ